MSLELEEEWAKEKAAKQEAGRNIKPPRKSRKGLIVALVGVALAAVLVAVVVLAGDKDKSTAGMVKVEIRAMPTAEIRVDGKKVGTTPMSLQFPSSSKEITVEATMLRHLIGRVGTKDEKYVGRRVIKLDRDHLLDFNPKNSALVESVKSGDD